MVGILSVLIYIYIGLITRFSFGYNYDLLDSAKKKKLTFA